MYFDAFSTLFYHKNADDELYVALGVVIVCCVLITAGCGFCILIQSGTCFNRCVSGFVLFFSKELEMYFQ